MPLAPPSFRGARSASPESILTMVVMDSGPAPCGASRNDDERERFRQNDSGWNGASPLHERLLDHEMAGRAAIAFEEAAGLEHLFQLFQHRGAAAHHDAVGGDVERLLPDIVKDLLRGDE